MPDISMCRDFTCPLRVKCYRFMAEPDEYQAYADFGSERNGDVCKYYEEVV